MSNADPQTQQHADQLRRALSGRPDLRELVATATGKSVRAVGYWTSKTNPVMPNEYDRSLIRKIVGEYDATGDDVEVAIKRTNLVDWRKSAVLSEYRRHLHEQAREEAM